MYKRNDSNIWWMRYRDKTGRRRLESTNTTDWTEAQRQMRERLDSRDNNTLDASCKGNQMTFGEWADFFLENYSKPPIRAQKTHAANENALKSLRPTFGTAKLPDIDATQIEMHLRRRLKAKKRVLRKTGVVELGTVKPTTVHQEFRVLRRMFSVAVKKKLCPVNPCVSVEFPVILKGLFRPHYMTWTEQTRIESEAPPYLKNVVRIITETGLRPYKELAPMRKDQVDLPNKVVFIADSKTPTGVAEVPLTDIATEAFKSQLELAGPGPWLFPSAKRPGEPQANFKKTWERTLRKAGVSYFRLYDLRSTYATRLSAGGVADEWVTQLLRQTDAKVFKKYSQMKLQMKREALARLNRQASESGVRSFDTATEA
ncbi:MAG TPA: tyrosine-type recombinase/integrase [Bryobacteraceae bacterium]|nr:tyrosine-type recombinase/integrase [Bryobacteraceae bacterium]